MLLYVFLFFLLLLLCVSYIMSDEDILAAPNTLCIGFIIATIVSIINVDLWQFDMSYETFAVLVIGILSFIIAYFSIITYKRGNNKNINVNVNVFNITTMNTVLFNILQLIVIYFTYVHIIEMADFFSVGDTPIEKIGAVRSLGMFGDIENTPGMPQLPWIIGKIKIFCTIGFLFYLYDIAYRRVNKKYISRLHYVVVILHVIISSLSGGRYGIIVMVFAYIVFNRIIKMKKKSWYIPLHVRDVIKFIMLLPIGITLFTLSLFAVGRKQLDNVDFFDLYDIVWDQLSVYAGAELKLLDIYITKQYTSANDDVFGIHTMPVIFKWIGSKINNEWQFIDLGGLEFNNINGINLGNVYTMFMTYYADGGIIGVIFFSTIMGLFFGYVFYRIKYCKHNNLRGIDYATLIYGYYYYSAPFAFFSYWFFFSININTLWELLSLITFPIIFTKNRSQSSD